ncbi:MAG: hypothetical protein ABFS35_18395 [Bacteroidota bacterium]
MKIFRKVTGFLLILFLYLILGCSSQKNISSSLWCSENVIIDGDFTDWKGKTTFYDNSTRISYGIINDSSILYIGVLIPDQTLQAKILRTGMHIAVDTTGKKQMSPCIIYPYAGENALANIDINNRTDFNGIKRRFKLNVQSMHLSGFKTNNGVNPVQAANGVAVGLNWNENGDMFIEACIPLNSLGRKDLNPADVANVYSLNISIPAVEPPDFVRNGGGRPSGISGGGGRPGGGGPPSWVTNGNSGMTMLLEEQIIRQKFYLKIK